jgi:hypothetical protein
VGEVKETCIICTVSGSTNVLWSVYIFSATAPLDLSLLATLRGPFRLVLAARHFNSFPTHSPPFRDTNNSIRLSWTRNSPNIQRNTALKRTTARIRNHRVQPLILGTRRLKENMHIRRITLFKHGNRGIVVRLQDVNGIRAENALGVGEAPVEAADDFACTLLVL